MKRMMMPAALLGVLVFPPPTVAQTREAIGLFFDADCSTCSATIPPGQQKPLYIGALRGGASAQYGLTGAEFRVVGLPPEWIVTCTPNPSSVTVLGDPFGAGADMGFFPLAGTCVGLFTCSITATTDAVVYLRVTAHSRPHPVCPSSPAILCDCAPAITIVCASGGEAVINGGACTVGVQTKTWSQVRRLYGQDE